MAKRPLTFAEEVLLEILRNMPQYECNSFHHDKKDRHDHTEDCPVMARFRNAEAKGCAYFDALSNPTK